MKPRYYQQAAHDAAWHHLRTESGSPLIVLPTGAGKSLVIAMLVEQARAYDARVIVLQHRKELIEQNAEKIRILLPNIRVGIYSAGLGKRNLDEDVICAGIQSIYRKAHEVGRRELVVIDEAHLINASNGESMYSRFLYELRQINPTSRVVGLTATPYRTGEGSICGDDQMFESICYQAQTGQLVDEGYLCPITNKAAEATVDTSSIQVRGGEFVASSMEEVFDDDGKVFAACSEIVSKCAERNSILIFASGVAHAEHIRDVLEDLTGDIVGLVTGDTFVMKRKAFLSDFKQQKLRWLVNCDVLTTGFDAPCIDAIAVLRATMSPGLFAQIVGRGLRKHDSKTDCLILDFGGNLKRHGSLDDPGYGIKDKTTEKDDPNGENTGEVEPVTIPDDDPETKLCFGCENEVPVHCRECPECGLMFPTEPIPPRHDTQPDEDSPLLGSPDPEVWIVESVAWAEHHKKNDPNALPTLRVDYTCQPDGGDIGNLTRQVISEWICLEHDGFAGRKAQTWWREHSDVEPPGDIESAVWLLDQGAARMPDTITSQRDGKWNRVISRRFSVEKPDVRDEWTTPTVDVSWVDDDVPF